MDSHAVTPTATSFLCMLVKVEFMHAAVTIVDSITAFFYSLYISLDELN